MPRFTYTQQPNKRFELIPDGDYILEVVKAEPCISQAQKYRGAEQFEVTFRTEDGSEFTDWITFHPELDWKVDNFLTAFSFPIQKGEEAEITPENIIGLRGWCFVSHYEKNGKKYNQVKVYYTDKEKFPRQQAEPVAAAAAPWE